MDYLIQTPNQLASHLRSLRRAHRLTQAQLGTLVGLDQTRIAKIEKDPRRISVTAITRARRQARIESSRRDHVTAHG